MIVDAVDELETARAEMLGSREERASTGQTRFQRDPRAKPMKNGPQCFPINNMVQRACQVEGPAAALKTVNNTPDAHQLRVQRFVRVSCLVTLCDCGIDHTLHQAVSTINVLAWELQGPEGLRRAARDYGEMVNTPRLGHPRNYYWPSQQINIASAQHPHDGMFLGVYYIAKLDMCILEPSAHFKKQQGRFSGKHIDDFDASHGHSCGNSLGDTPDVPGCEPGRFHLVGLGIYVQLRYRLQVFFTGLLHHGGTPPLVPDDYELAGWETRMFVISYPASTILTGEARHSFASLPYQGRPQYISPEMTGAPLAHPGSPFHTNHPTIAQDGWVVMDRRSLVNFIVRGGLQQLRWVLRQLPPSLRLHISANDYIRAISFSEEGTDDLVHPDDWDLAPEDDVQHPFSDRHKDVQDEYLKVENDRLIAGIPSVDGNAFADWDVTDMDYGHRTQSM